MHHNIGLSLFKDVYEENGIIEVFKRNNEIIIIENFNNKEDIIKDTRKDKNEDITHFDLVFLHTINRYYSNSEIKGMIYENIDSIGYFYRVKIDGYKPSDKLLRPFYLKKMITKDKLSKYANNDKELKYLENFFDIKGDIRFNRPSSIRKIFKF